MEQNRQNTALGNSSNSPLASPDTITPTIKPRAPPTTVFGRGEHSAFPNNRVLVWEASPDELAAKAGLNGDSIWMPLLRQAEDEADDVLADIEGLQRLHPGDILAVCLPDELEKHFRHQVLLGLVYADPDHDYPPSAQAPATKGIPAIVARRLANAVPLFTGPDESPSQAAGGRTFIAGLTTLPGRSGWAPADSFIAPGLGGEALEREKQRSRQVQKATALCAAACEMARSHVLGGRSVVKRGLELRNALYLPPTLGGDANSHPTTSTITTLLGNVSACQSDSLLEPRTWSRCEDVDALSPSITAHIPDPRFGDGKGIHGGGMLSSLGFYYIAPSNTPALGLVSERFHCVGLPPSIVKGSREHTKPPRTIQLVAYGDTAILNLHCARPATRCLAGGDDAALVRGLSGSMGLALGDDSRAALWLARHNLAHDQRQAGGSVQQELYLQHSAHGIVRVWGDRASAGLRSKTNDLLEDLDLDVSGDYTGIIPHPAPPGLREPSETVSTARIALAAARWHAEMLSGGEERSIDDADCAVMQRWTRTRPALQIPLESFDIDLGLEGKPPSPPVTPLEDTCADDDEPYPPSPRRPSPMSIVEPSSVREPPEELKRKAAEVDDAGQADGGGHGEGRRQAETAGARNAAKRARSGRDVPTRLRVPADIDPCPRPVNRLVSVLLPKLLKLDTHAVDVRGALRALTEDLHGPRGLQAASLKQQRLVAQAWVTYRLSSSTGTSSSSSSSSSWSSSSTSSSSSSSGKGRPVAPATGVSRWQELRRQASDVGALFGALRPDGKSPPGAIINAFERALECYHSFQEAANDLAERWDVRHCCFPGGAPASIITLAAFIVQMHGAKLAPTSPAVLDVRDVVASKEGRVPASVVEGLDQLGREPRSVPARAPHVWWRRIVQARKDGPRTKQAVFAAALLDILLQTLGAAMIRHLAHDGPVASAASPLSRAAWNRGVRIMWTRMEILSELRRAHRNRHALCIPIWLQLLSRPLTLLPSPPRFRFWDQEKSIKFPPEWRARIDELINATANIDGVQELYERTLLKAGVPAPASWK